jgi:hypothetical protein
MPVVGAWSGISSHPQEIMKAINNDASIDATEGADSWVCALISNSIQQRAGFGNQPVSRHKYLQSPISN